MLDVGTNRLCVCAADAVSAGESGGIGGMMVFYDILQYGKVQSV